MRCHRNTSHRIVVLKLIFLLFWVDLEPGYQKMAGCKLPDPSTPLWGAFWFPDAPRTSPEPIFANNDGIFMSLGLFSGFLMTPTPFMILQKRPEVLLPFHGGNNSFIVLRKVKIRSHYAVCENLVMQYHIFGVFKHGKTFGAVVWVIRHSCYEIRSLDHISGCIV